MLETVPEGNDIPTSPTLCLTEAARYTPSTSDLLKSVLTPHNGKPVLQVAHVNAQSLLSHFDEFHSIFSPLSFHVILLSETWLKPSLSSSLVHLPGYTLLRNDRTLKRGGGVGAFVRSDLQPKIIHHTPCEYSAHPEIMFVEITTSYKKCLICVVYKPPRVGFLNDLETPLSDLIPLYEHVLIFGDFNTNLLNTNDRDTRMLCEMFQSLDLSILPLKPTYHTATSDTLLDLIITKKNDNVLIHGQLPAPGISGHDIIYVAYSLQCPKAPRKTITYRDLKHINDTALLEDALLLPWHTILHAHTVDEKVEILNNLILHLYDKHAPLKEKRTNRPPAPWMTPTIKELMAERDQAFRKYKHNKCDINLEKYKQLRNRTTQTIRNAKLRHMYSLTDPNMAQTTKWLNIRSIGIGKTMQQVETTSIPLDKLNEHFTNVTYPPKDTTSQQTQTYTHLTRDKFHFRYIMTEDVISALKRLKTKATGVDNISITLVNKILPIILPTLTHIFNASLMTGTFPTLWKKAYVHPVPKVKVPLTPSDYRPICILPALSKVLERIVHKQLTDYLNEHNLLDPYQSGFRSGHSCTTAILNVTEDIRESMDKSLLTIMTLLDFTNAFGSVNIDLLICKLRALNLSDYTVNWFHSYLYGRQQCVISNNKYSSWMALRAGVPQGSVLGPLLFAAYINDLSQTLRHCKYMLYADDVVLYTHTRPDSINDTVGKLNLDLNSILEWTNKFDLTLNPRKSQAIIVGHQRSIRSLHSTRITPVTLNETTIPYCSSVKYLGVYIDETLNWKPQVAHVCKTVFSVLHSLNLLKKFLPFQLKRTLVQALLMPHFDYCDILLT